MFFFKLTLMDNFVSLSTLSFMQKLFKYFRNSLQLILSNRLLSLNVSCIVERAIKRTKSIKSIIECRKIRRLIMRKNLKEEIEHDLFYQNIFIDADA